MCVWVRDLLIGAARTLEGEERRNIDAEYVSGTPQTLLESLCRTDGMIVEELWEIMSAKK